MTDQIPDFPPRMTGHPCPEGLRPYEYAREQAGAGQLGAGDVVWARAPQVAHAAFVLEPEVALEQAMQIWPTAVVAVGDMLGALAPPQVAVMYRFPGTILINGGNAGHVRVASSTTDAKQVPDWMVVEVYLRMLFDGTGQEPGDIPEMTSLAEEGCPDLTNAQLLSSFSRHFMTWIYDWGEDGFKPVADAWRFRAEQGDGEDDKGHMTFMWRDRSFEGTFLGLDENGNLLLKPESGDAMALNLIDDVDHGCDHP